MQDMQFLGAPRSLRAWFANLGQFPGDGWLYVRSEKSPLSLDTPCWPGVISAECLSSDEQELFEEQFDEWLDEQGFTEFLNEDDLEQIVANLEQQRPNFSEHELAAAITHYRQHDVFIDLKSHPGAARETQRTDSH